MKLTTGLASRFDVRSPAERVSRDCIGKPRWWGRRPARVRDREAKPRSRSTNKENRHDDRPHPNFAIRSSIFGSVDGLDFPSGAKPARSRQPDGFDSRPEGRMPIKQEPQSSPVSATSAQPLTALTPRTRVGEAIAHLIDQPSPSSASERSSTHHVRWTSLPRPPRLHSNRPAPAGRPDAMPNALSVCLGGRARNRSPKCGEPTAVQRSRPPPTSPNRQASTPCEAHV
jgi:hypothetical protein